MFDGLDQPEGVEGALGAPPQPHPGDVEQPTDGGEGEHRPLILGPHDAGQIAQARTPARLGPVGQRRRRRVADHEWVGRLGHDPRDGAIVVGGHGGEDVPALGSPGAQRDHVPLPADGHGLRQPAVRSRVDPLVGGQVPPSPSSGLEVHAPGSLVLYVAPPCGGQFVVGGR